MRMAVLMMVFMAVGMSPVCVRFAHNPFTTLAAAQAAPYPLSIFMIPTPGAQLESILASAARPPCAAPYPTDVGTPKIGLGVSRHHADQRGVEPATTITASKVLISSSRSASRHNPATPQSSNSLCPMPRYASVRAASQATKPSAVPAEMTATLPLPFGGERVPERGTRQGMIVIPCADLGGNPSEHVRGKPCEQDRMPRAPAKTGEQLHERLERLPFAKNRFRQPDPGRPGVIKQNAVIHILTRLLENSETPRRRGEGRGEPRPTGAGSHAPDVSASWPPRTAPYTVISS